MDSPTNATPVTHFRNKWIVTSGVLLPGLDGSQDLQPTTGFCDNKDAKSLLGNALFYGVAYSAGILEPMKMWMDFLVCGSIPLDKVPSDHQVAINYSECQTKLVSKCSRLVGMILFMTKVKVPYKSINTYCHKIINDELMPLFDEMARLHAFKWNVKKKCYTAPPKCCYWGGEPTGLGWSWMYRAFPDHLTPHAVFDSKVGNKRGATVRANKITYSKRQPNKVGRLVRSKE